MATFLYKIGRFAFRRRHFVALFWVALLTLAGVGAANAPAAGSTSPDVPTTSMARQPRAMDSAREKSRTASPNATKAGRVLHLRNFVAFAISGVANVHAHVRCPAGVNLRRLNM